MTSKEALEIIKTDKTLQFHTETKFAVCPSDYYKRELDIIEKDLEVLEILKKHMYEYKGCLSAFLDEKIDKKDFAKIKEWLDNE